MVETGSENNITIANPTKTPASKRSLDPQSIAQETKRRRLNVATNTLSKPFRSPLLSGRKPSSNRTPPKAPEEPQSPTPVVASKARKIPTLVPRSRPLSFAKQPIDPELAALYKQQSQLEATLRSKKASLDTALQAVKIESAEYEDSDEKLEELIEKWRGAARGAADVLFEYASERVSNMGSSGGWKEMLRPKNPWGDDEKPQEAEQRPIEQEEDDEFTMEVMLKTLNIDLNLIGYDRERDCWS
ncbi:uncharacterized protein H6S33_003471 [Morchella sextelata]|uniref:uncharacterized protein n=1 Tax=Morchella sextelata TaxID=1174677 RepID=UPI001D03B551|nr:uncharacterized protein H6S33_003471 [Morchella sextelata]KAH0606637.1 hypothetical protein H6S33_003471 [Morchella sextelata]